MVLWSVFGKAAAAATSAGAPRPAAAVREAGVKAVVGRNQDQQLIR
jgi:hypothetical protein